MISTGELVETGGSDIFGGGYNTVPVVAPDSGVHHESMTYFAT